MRKIAILLLMFGMAALQSAAGQEVKLPADIPPYGPAKPIATPAVQQTTLANGLTVWMLPRKGFPKVTFLLSVRGGFAADPAGKAGIAEFLAEAVSQGTTTRSAQQIAEELQSAGANVRAESNPDAIMLSTTALAFRHEAALSALADMAQNAAFPAAQVEIVRGTLANSLQRRQADANFVADRALAAALFGDHPYAITAPTAASIAAISAADLRAEYARRFRPDNALLVAVGDFDRSAMLVEIRSSFGRWHAERKLEIADIPAPQQHGMGTVLIVPRPNSVQTRYYLASLGPTERDPDYAAAQVATFVCGHRISRNVREDKGYAYSAGSETEGHREANLLLTAAAVRTPVTGAAWNEMRYELDRMATTTASAGEVERAQHFLVGYAALSLQAQSAMARRLAQLWTDGLPPEQLAREGEEIDKVGAADVQRIGRTFLPSSRMTIVAVGDAKAIADQLATFGAKLNVETSK